MKDGFKGTKSPLNLPTESPAVYPNLYFLFQDLFGVEISALKLVNSFGLLVALAFVAGSGLLRRELQRKEKEGALDPTEKQVWVGKPEGPLSWASSGLLGFLLGWKVLWLLWNASDLFTGVAPPQRHLFSGEGYPLLGLAVAALMAWLRWKEDVKQRLDQPEQRKLKVHPWERTGNITLVAAVGGVTGAKLFHLLEYPDEFVAFFQAPSLQAFIGGLTIYGGLIVGGLAVAAYARRHRMPFLHLADATAPGLMLAYGIGRLGCQISGDGDWGIPNTHPQPNWLSWLPEWTWSYNFPNNVNGVGRFISESDPWTIYPGYGTCLNTGVYPTSLYETTMAVILFAVLWKLRKRFSTAGLLFATYLMLNGVERFFIEKIRVNTTFDFLGITMTQAELIAVLMFIGGATLFYFLKKRKRDMN